MKHLYGTDREASFEIWCALGTFMPLAVKMAHTQNIFLSCKQYLCSVYRNES